eukprot:TRINITY_DN76146_c0_g1_i1.p1 TRINITY_DN76146_c0_g1~~TRINITY_DN76146_c0_g1_i1.p1  ORF type:complete len:543 (-),score=114.38 TRINITY_DN76146_c0_g1_i1:26-1654(-)
MLRQRRRSLVGLCLLLLAACQSRRPVSAAFLLQTCRDGGISILQAWSRPGRVETETEEDAEIQRSLNPNQPGLESVPSRCSSDAERALQQAIAVLGSLSSLLLALLVGLVLSLSPSIAAPGLALAASPKLTADEENVEAAVGFVQRNFYDQTFNNQDWPTARQRYLERARRGERAEGIIREMIASLGDRFSRVIDASTYEQLMAFDPLGVGVVLTRNENKEAFVSSPPFKGSSAAKAGIKQGDIVTALDGLSLKEQSLFSVMDRITQKDSSEVTLSIQRRGDVPGSEAEPGRPLEVTLARSRKAAPQSEVDYGVVGAGNRIGYFRLRNFGARSPLDVRAALEKLRGQGAKELVIDLRGNGGGSFQAALEIAEIFLEPGSVAAQVQTPKSSRQPLRVEEVSDTSGVAKEPLAVLVDGSSASASEVLAVALRGNCRAPLLGARTYGKAAVQGVFGLPNREALALTVARYSGPGGTQIEGGLEPDLPGPGVSLPGGFLPGGGNSFAAAASLFGLPAQLQAGDYASLDIAGATASSLKSCRASEAW